ncbi:hypothetical protein LTR53_018093, partial [Teratosphaeriaceae sp. CCFEE 6253]
MAGPVRSPEKNPPFYANKAVPTPAPTPASKQAATTTVDPEAGTAAHGTVNGTSDTAPNSLSLITGAVKALDTLHDIFSARESQALATQDDLAKLREQLQAQCTAQAAHSNELVTKTAELAAKSSSLRTATAKLVVVQGQLSQAQNKVRKRGLNIIMSQAGHPTKLYFREKKHSLASLMA